MKDVAFALGVESQWTIDLRHNLMPRGTTTYAAMHSRAKTLYRFLKSN